MVDWSVGHGPISGTFNAATGAVAATTVAAAAGVAPGWPLLAGAVGALGGTIGGLAREDHEKLSGGALAFRATSWLAAAGWSCFALMHRGNPLTPDTLAAIGLSSVFLGLIGTGLSSRKRRKIEAAKAVERAGVANQWADRLQRVCGLRGEVKILAVEWWAEKSGFTLDIDLPEGGYTYQDIRAHSDRLAGDAKLPEGCGVEVEPGPNRGSAFVKVSLVNTLDGVHDLPLDCSPLDFEKHFDMGKARDGELALINLREYSAMLAGQKGSGKTNLLRVIITRLMRMPNLLIWVIDYNSGSLALPFIKAWDDAGRPGKPPIDWVADNDDEVLRMVKTAEAVAKRRKIAYQTLMYDANTDLLPMTPDIPGILVLSDEGAEFLGVHTKAGAEYAAKRKIADTYLEVLRIARSVGVNEFTCGLRATSDVFGDSMFKAQSRVKIGMMMDNPDEIAYLLGWDAKVTPQDMPSRGYGVFADGETQVVKAFKAYRALPSHLKEITVGTAQYRAELTGECLEAAGPDYADRWARATWLEAMKLAPVAAGQASGSTVVMEKPKPVDPISAAFDGPPRDPSEVQREIDQAMGQTGGGDMPDDIDKQFESIMSAEDWGDPSRWSDVLPVEPEQDGEEDGDDSQPGGIDFKTVVFGVVKASGVDGIKPADIHRSLVKAFPDRKNIPVIKTITRWLQADERIYQPMFGHYAIKPKKGGN
jgi:hypothetical protein